MPRRAGCSWMESGRSFLGGLMGRPLPTRRAAAAALTIMGWSRTGPPPGPRTMPRTGPPASMLMPPREERVSGEESWIWPPCPPFPRPTMRAPADSPTGSPMVEGVVVSAFRFTPFFCNAHREEAVVDTVTRGGPYGYARTEDEKIVSARVDGD